MKLIFRGHDDRYAIEQSLLAFFPEERPVYETAEAGEDDCAYVSLTEGKRYATGVTSIHYHGKTARGVSRAVLADAPDEYERERLRQRALKLSFFKAARDITGVTPSWGALTGIRPGKPTSDFITKTLSKITLIGAIFLAIVAGLPIILGNITGTSIQLGGTSLLIVVGVALETGRSLEGYMTARHHKGFLE